MYCKQHFTENYKTLYEIWRERNPTCRMYMDAKKLLNQKNYIMKHNKITELEIEDIKRKCKQGREREEKKRKRRRNASI